MKNEMIIENEKNKPFVFISYSHKDSEAVLQVIKELQKNSYRVWYDDGIDPGTEWDKNIAEHVENCGYFIAFISKNYISSSNCKDELNFARDLEKKRFLVYIEEVELPSEMKMRLSRIQNIHKYKYDNDKDFYNKLFSADGLDEFKATTRNEHTDFDEFLENKNLKIDDLIKVTSKKSAVSLNKSQRKELMSCKCFYCGMHAEMLSDTDGYYAECVHCGAVGTIADTIDAAITNWKLCMTEDDEHSGQKLCKDTGSFIESKASKINAYFDDTINSIDTILDEIQDVLDSNDDDIIDSESLLEKTEQKQENRRPAGRLALNLNDVLITTYYKQQFRNPITLRMPDNERLEFEFIEKSTLDEKYIIVSRLEEEDYFVFSIFKNPEGTANPPTAIFEGKKLKKIYRAFMENHKNEYEFTDKIAMQPNIQPRKSEQPRVFTEKTAQGMFGPYFKDVIEIPCKYTLIDSHIFNCASTPYLPKKISKLIIPDSVTKIEAFAFSDIIVDEIEVSDNVTEIGVEAFKLSADGFIACAPDSYAYKYAKYHDLRNSVDIANDYKIKGVCAYCGGKFSGVFKKKCSLCGKEKDY